MAIKKSLKKPTSRSRIGTTQLNKAPVKLKTSRIREPEFEDLDDDDNEDYYRSRAAEARKNRKAVKPKAKTKVTASKVGKPITDTAATQLNLSGDGTVSFPQIQNPVVPQIIQVPPVPITNTKQNEALRAAIGALTHVASLYELGTESRKFYKGHAETLQKMLPKDLQ